ncbi:bifunctional 2-polyprenyl-6-hydroxyphenol methylase/3-demethylubiquinol 3-O-methyltransferase UbiG [Arthrobacter sp. zg-Y1116]|uniref:class I SAM-dependent methyltransferase n=1 Tax=Arthrobacter sp. zg-Y1116 TaxID=2964611 RepID=UPI00210671A1|nr:class I SAM-dependent methyltransferase [Arthrobacter sp. zg-Y1116]MCQ1946083.1 methyltransferase domain-containing protein [Arthrobacter sp. zg-Y1116]
MTHSFDKDYWEQHWHEAPDTAPAGGHQPPANPYVARLAAELPAGTPLDAGCGTGAEALELAAHGWTVVGADVSASALAAASRRAEAQTLSGSVDWIEADLVSWEPGRRFDLVTTNYAHPAMPQLTFYTRVAEWVAPGGTLLIVGHAHDDEATTAHGHHPPADTVVTAEAIRALLDPATWSITVAEEHPRSMTAPDGSQVTLRDVVVQAVRER